MGLCIIRYIVLCLALVDESFPLPLMTDFPHAWAPFCECGIFSQRGVTNKLTISKFYYTRTAMAQSLSFASLVPLFGMRLLRQFALKFNQITTRPPLPSQNLSKTFNTSSISSLDASVCARCLTSLRMSHPVPETPHSTYAITLDHASTF